MLVGYLAEVFSGDSLRILKGKHQKKLAKKDFYYILAIIRHVVIQNICGLVLIKTIWKIRQEKVEALIFLVAKVQGANLQ